MSLTNLSSRPFTNSIFSQFPTRSGSSVKAAWKLWTCRDHLISSLLCSCYLPLISGPNPPSLQVSSHANILKAERVGHACKRLCILQGERFLDGGFTQQFPTSLIPAVRVSPFRWFAECRSSTCKRIFSGYEKEICPRDQPGPGVTLSGENMHFSRCVPFAKAFSASALWPVLIYVVHCTGLMFEEVVMLFAVLVCIRWKRFSFHEQTFSVICRLMDIIIKAVWMGRTILRKNSWTRTRPIDYNFGNKTTQEQFRTKKPWLRSTSTRSRRRSC